MASESTILVSEKGSVIYNILGYESTFENDRFLALNPQKLTIKY